MDSAIDVYRDMAQGSAQINPLSEFFQEAEASMKTGKPIFEGKGISRAIHFQMPFRCESNVDDQGCSATFDKTETSIINNLEADTVPSGYSVDDKYDYSKGVFFDYSKRDYKKVEKFMTLCNPKTDNTGDNCLERIFECGDLPWSPPKDQPDAPSCSKTVSFCPDHVPGTDIEKVCKYDLNNQLIKEYLRPLEMQTKSRRFCKTGETPQDCYLRFECGPENSNLSCSNLVTCSDDSDFTCKYKRTGEFVKRFFNPESPIPITSYSNQSASPAVQSQGVPYSLGQPVRM